MGLYVFHWSISVLGDWKDISIAHVIIIIKSEVSTFPIVITFSWLRAWDVCYIIFCHLLHILAGKTGICFHYFCAVYEECKYSGTFWLVGRTRLFEKYTISLSSLCKLIWRHWTYKRPVRYILSSKIKHVLRYPLYNMWGCMFSVYPFLLWWLREYIYFVLLSSSNRKYELLPIV